MVDLASVQAFLVELVLDDATRCAWLADPKGVATERVGAGPAAQMLAGLDRRGVLVTAAVAAAKAGIENDATRVRPGGIEHRRATPLRTTAVDALRTQLGRPLVGCGYRPSLLRHLWRSMPLVEVWEHTVDDFVGAGEAGVEAMARFAASRPLSLHSLNLSVGTAQNRVSPEHLDAIAAIVAAAGVDCLSDHLAISRAGNRQLLDFLPLWRTEEQLDVVVRNVQWLQTRLGVRLGLENPSVFFDPGGELGYAEFMNEVVRRSGCGILLDLTNLLMDEANSLRDAGAVLAELDLGAIVGVHLAGGSVVDGVNVDSHDHAVPVADLELLSSVLPKLPNCATVIVERDDRFEEAAEIVADIEAVHRVVRSSARTRAFARA